MSHRNWYLLVLVLLVSMAAAACGGGSNGTLDANRPPAEADVQAAVQEVVLPALQQLGVYSAAKPLPTAGAAPPPSQESGAPAPAAENCLNLSCSSGGTFQFCWNAADGTFLSTSTYDSCSQPGGTVDGTWSLQLSNSTATAAFSLSVGELGLAGDVSYVKQSSCWNHSISGFTASGPRYTIGIDGDALYCPGVRPVGQLEMQVTGDTSFDASFEFNASVGTLVLVDNEGTVHTCTIDMVSGEASCDEG